MCYTRCKPPPPPPMWPVLKCTGSSITFQTKVSSRTPALSRIQAPNEFVHHIVPILHFHPAYPHYGCVHKPLLSVLLCEEHSFSTSSRMVKDPVHITVHHTPSNHAQNAHIQLKSSDEFPGSPFSSTDSAESSWMLWMAAKRNAYSNLQNAVSNIYCSYCSLLPTIPFYPARIWNNLQVTAATQLKLETHGSFNKLQVTFSWFYVCCYSSARYSSDALQNQTCFFYIYIYCHTNKRC